MSRRTPRDFEVVLKEMYEIAPDNLKEKLEGLAYIAPEEEPWRRLSECIHRNMRPSSKNEISVKIYALLCNCSEEQMKSQFEASGH